MDRCHLWELRTIYSAEISAIMNHEKTSWGNNAKKVTPEEIQKLMDAAKKQLAT